MLRVGQAVLDADISRAAVVPTRRDEVCLVRMHTGGALALVAEGVAA